jgi:polyphenol oxidase
VTLATRPPWYEEIAVADGAVVVRCSTVADGDFHLERDPVDLHRTRQSFQPGRWSQPDEVHGVDVAWVEPQISADRVVADVVMTRCHDEVLGIWVGDCAPVALVSSDGVLAGVHAGWRGALDGVLDRALDAMRSSANVSVSAVLGPCIHPCCYEFGAAELDRFVRRFGEGVVGATAWNTPALDMPEVVRRALAERDVTLRDRSVCTGCSPGVYFSHRRRSERGRHVLTLEKRVAR